MNENKNEDASNILSTPEEILWKLTDQEMFIRLREMFKNEEKQNDPTNTIIISKPSKDEGVNKETFLQMVTTILGDETIGESQILDLFNKIDTQDVQRITWDDFLDFNLKALQPQSENPLQLGDITYHQPKEFKRDSIVKIVLLETDLYFSYSILTKYGKICLMDAEFRHLTSYQAIMSREDQFRSAKEARKRYRWLTDAIFMADINMFVVVNSTCSMTIYDASGLKHVPLWHISGFPNVVQVIAYAGIFNRTNGKKSLILGMDNGEIAIMTFLKPKDDLLPKKHQDKMSLYYFLEIGNFKDYLQYKTLGKFHACPVVGMQLLDDRKSIVTCGRDDKKSLIILNMEYSTVSRSISTRRGINCFTANCNMKIFITGSDDGVVRVWPLHKKLPNVHYSKTIKYKKAKERTTSLKPLEINRVGKTGIVDIIILETLGIFICCTRDAELKFYDLKEYKNIQNLKLSFECFDIFKIRTPEWGTKCIFPGPKRTQMSQTWERNCLLITCCNAYAKIDLFYMDGRDRHLHGDLLPPQPLQNSVLIPQDWECPNGTTECINVKTFDSTNERFEKLCDDLLNLNLTSKEKSDVHSKIALLEERKSKMKWAVEHGAPFLGLELYEVEEVQLPMRLPTVENKKTKCIVEKTRKLLSDAVSHAIIFSDISSLGTSRSSRSSSKSSKSSKSSNRSNNSINSRTSGRFSRISSRTSLLEFE